jgi:Subtilase family
MRTTTRRFFLLAAGLAAALTAVPAAPARAQQPPKVSDELWSMIDPAVCTGACRTTRIPVLIRLVAQVDLDAVTGGLRTKAERLPVVVAALKQLAATTQDASGCGPGLLTWLGEQGANATGVTSLWIVNGVAADAVPDVIVAAADRADVSAVTFNGDYAGPIVTGGTAAPATTGGGAAAAGAGGPPPNLVAIHVPEVWAAGLTGACPPSVSGACAKVGIIGTGVDATHPALASNLLRRPDGSAVWRDALGGPDACPGPDPCDPVGEGTHLAGVAVGTAQQIGVAPGARWLACRAVFVGTDGRLHPDDAATATCLQFMADPDGDGSTTHAADVVVFPAWKLPGRADRQFVDQMRSLRAGGILPVVAGGHDVLSPLPPDCGVETDPLQCGLPSLANYPEVVSVGSSDNNSPPQLLATSFRGTADVGALGEPFCAPGQTTGCVTPVPGPRLYAPGINVTSAWPGGGYQVLTWNAEGVAAAHVAGVAALIYGRYAPGAAPPIDYIDRALQTTAEGWAASPYVPGELDAFGAVNYENAEVAAENPPAAGSLGGTVVPASVSMRNTGVVPWTLAAHKLDAIRPGNRIGVNDCNQSQVHWGTTRLSMAQATVAPGEVADFPFPVLPGKTVPGALVPVPSGPYLFQWQMTHVGRPAPLPEAFGPTSTAFSVTSADGSQGVTGSIGTPLVPTAPPQRCTDVTLRFNNTGNATWKPGVYRIRQLAGRGEFPNGYHDLTANVCTQGNVSVPLTLCVPYDDGTWTWSFQLEKNGVGIGPTVSTSVTVPSVDNATFGGWSGLPPVEMVSWTWVTASMCNTGSTTWSGTSFYLVPEPSNVWAIASHQWAGSVAPGQCSTFAIELGPPWDGRPGRFPLPFRLGRNGAPFGASTGTSGLVANRWRISAHSDLTQYPGIQGRTSGPNYWFWRFYNGSNWRMMNWDGGQGRWEGTQGGQWISDGGQVIVHPGPDVSGIDYPSGIFWKSPVASTVHLSGSVWDDNGTCGDGIKLRVRKNDDAPVIDTNLANGFGTTPFAWDVALAVNDTLRIIINPRSNNNCDGTDVYAFLIVDIPPGVVGDLPKSPICVQASEGSGACQ